MDKSRKKSAALCAGIFVVLGMWMILSVHCRAAEMNSDEKLPQAVEQDESTQQETKKSEAQTTEQKIIRVGSFEDTFDYVDKNGVRRGYGYELLQALAGYAGWKFEYVKCDWSNCFDMLENGEIDVMGDISYTDERAQKMLFSDEAMGEEKYILYADLSNMDIGTSDFRFMDGKRVGVLMGTEPEIMLTEWENRNGIQTEHINVYKNDDVEKKLANHEIDAFVSLEESIWSEQGISSVIAIGKSGIYFAINKVRSDIKTELDFAMCQLEQDSPFFKADLYKKYFTLDYNQSLMGGEKSWLKEHGDIRIGFLSNDPAIFSMDEETGKLTGMPSDMLTSALAIYDSTADKVTFSDFVKDNLPEFLVAAGFFTFSIISIILALLRKARRAEAVARIAANDTQKLNDKLEIALKKAENASLSKTCFLNNMSHDIRTPMNAILGYAQLMEDELKEKELPETLEHLEKLQQSGNLLLSIINNVLDMARIESGKMELDENYCRIEDVWKSLLAVFDGKAGKKNIALHYTMNVEHEHVLTDVTKVKEILVNILSNAIKYTPAGGSVMVNIDELLCDEPGYMIARTRVSDTGIGMSQDYLTKIFEAFTREQNTTKSKIAGTGLGMSIVRKYVDLLGGRINVESELGKGSTFTVTLKHRIADESYYAKKHIEEPGTGSEILEGRNILLAEDNDLNAEIAEAILKRAGFKTERVEDGIRCVGRIERMPAGTYDMILMDIQMPKMDGYKATQAIRSLPDKDKACIPIIAMTANAFEEDKRDAIAAGMNGHIAKPIQVDNLLSILSEIIRQQEK